MFHIVLAHISISDIQLISIYHQSYFKLKSDLLFIMG